MGLSKGGGLKLHIGSRTPAAGWKTLDLQAGPDDVRRQLEPHDFHRVGLTLACLEDYLCMAGVREVERVAEFGLFDDASGLRFGGIPISVNVRSRK